MRRAARAMGFAAVVIALAAGALWLARVPVAEQLVTWQLQRWGYPRAELEITRLGWREAVIRSVALRPGKESGVRIDRIEAGYRPLALVRGRYGHVRIAVTGLRARIEPAERRAARGAPGDGSSGPAGAPAAALRPERFLGGLPAIRVRDARIEVASPAGSWRVGLEGSIAADRSGRSRLAARIRNPRHDIQGRIDAGYRNGKLMVEAALREANGGAVRVDGELGPAGGGPRVSLGWELTAPAGSELPWGLLPGPAPVAGEVRTTGRARGRLAEAAVPRSAAGLVDGLTDGGWRADFTIDGRGLRMDGGFRGLAVEAEGTVRTRRDALVLGLAGTGGARVERLGGTARQWLAGHRFSGAWLDGPFELSWPEGELARLTTGDGPRGLEPRLRVRPILRAPGEDGRARLPDGRTGGAAFGRLALDLPLAVERADSDWRLRLTDAGSVTVEGAVLPGGWRAPREVRADVAEGRLAFGDGWRGSGRLALGKTRLEPPPDGGGPKAVTLSAGTIALGGPDPPTVAVRDGTLGLPAQDLAASGIRADWDPEGSGSWLEFALERVVQDASPSWLAPVTLSGRLERDGEGFRLAGRGRAAEGQLPLRLEGRAGPGFGPGTVSLRVPRFALGPEGLQPGGIVPALDGLKGSSGHVQGEIELSWDDGGPRGRAALALEGLNLEYGRASLTGAEGELALADLLAPATDGPQRLDAESLTAVATVSEPVLEVGAVPASEGGPAIAINRASGKLWGGRIGLLDEIVDPGDSVHKLVVRVAEISLGQLLEKLSVENLDGRGQLSGSIPVVLGAGRVAIRDGRLRSENGVIRFRSEYARRAVADTHKAIRLLVKALRDFHYDTLELGVTREPGADARLQIVTEGSNPEVLDGHPFRVNVSVTGDLESLLEEVARGRELTDRLIDQYLNLELR